MHARRRRPPAPTLALAAALAAAATLAAATPASAQRDDHGPAGRSAIPAEGETLSRPLPYARLQPEVLPDPPAGPVLWTDAPRYVGQWVSVEGKVVDTGEAKGIVFLNFTPHRPGSKDFSIVVFEEAWDELPGPPREYFRDRLIRVSGPVTVHRGRPNIVVRDASMIRAIDALTAAPTQAPASEALSPAEAAERVGDSVLVRGRVVNTRNIGDLTFLNFSDDPQGFYAVVFREVYDALPAPPEQHFLHQTVRVSGEVKLHRGRPQIQVRDAAQIALEP